MSPLRVLLVTDSFPPGSGGSGWSTFELARQLRLRGHDISVVHAAPGATTDVAHETCEGIAVTRFRTRVPNVPVLRNVLKNERLWASLAQHIIDRHARSPFDVLHAQHVMTTVPSVRAGQRLDLPVVATVRDYWPVCYWSDLIIDPSQRELCPSCTTTNMRTCTLHRPGSPGPASWAMIPYMRANLRRKQSALARADAVIGVSSAISRDLLARSPGLPVDRLQTIPNPVDMTDLDPPGDAGREPCVLYAGKLATNKGVQFLLPALDEAGVTWPLKVIGDGPLRPQLEADAARRGRSVQWLGWRDRSDVLSAMRRAAVLAFPSYGPESLSRVLIEASALGLPTAAMDTGGTRDILNNNTTGLLSATPEDFARDLARLCGDEALRRRLGSAAAQHVRAQFEASSVAARVEAVYRRLLTPDRGRPSA